MVKRKPIFRHRTSGRQPHHKYFERARRVARKLGHWLARFEKGKDEGPIGYAFAAHCRLCQQSVLVRFDTDTEPHEWKIEGDPVKVKCKGVI